MSEWREATLEDLCSLIVDSEHKTAPKSPDGQHPLIRTPDLGRARINLTTEQRVDRPTYLAWTKRAAPREGDLILAREAPVGGIGRVPRGAEPVLGQRTVLLRPDAAVVDSNFLTYRLAAPDAQSRMNELATGATVPHLNMSDIRSFSVDLPTSRAMQRRVAALLASFDELTEINERRIEVLEDLARSLYREWFVRFRFPGHETTKFVDSELGPIPEGWVADTVAGVASPARNAIAAGPFGSKLGRKDYRPDGVPVIRGANLSVGGGFTDDGFVFVDEAKADSLGSAIARPGDVIVTQRGTLGQVGLVPLRCRFDRYVISQSQMKISADLSAGTNLYLYFALSSEEITEMILTRAITAGVPHINLAMLRELPIRRPSVDVQEAFKDRVSCWIEQSLALQDVNRALVATRDLLLPRLVTGKLDISEIDLGVLTPSEAA